MEASIGRLHLQGRVVGARHLAAPAGVADLLTGDLARQRMLDALAAAFGDGEEVLVIRSLTCRAALRAGRSTAADVLASSIAASAARLVTLNPGDDTVVRFEDDAAYVAAFIHDGLGGHRRWYFEVFESCRRADGSHDWAALLAAHADRRWQILARVHANGDLENLLSALGREGTAELVTDLTTDQVSGWAPLVATAAGMLAASGGSSLPGETTRDLAAGLVSAPAPAAAAGPAADGELAAEAAGLASRLPAGLAGAQPPADWRDPASLGTALATVAAELLATVDPADAAARRDSMVAQARRHAWFDVRAFGDGLRMSPDGAPPAGVARAFSPRIRAVLGDLADAAADPGLHLDPGEPNGPANLVRLIAALAGRAPRWRDDALARSVAAHVLDVWARASGRSGTPAPPGGDRTAAAPPAEEPDAAPETAARPASGPPHPPSPASWGTPLPDDGRGGPATPHERHRAANEPGPGQDTIRDALHTSLRRPTPQAVAALLGHRFSRAGALRAQIPSGTACGLLLLRSVLDLGLATHLSLPGPGGEPLLGALLRRWAGRAADADAADPVLALLDDVARDRPGSGPAPARGLEDLCGLAVRRLTGQRLITGPYRPVTVPHAERDVATVLAGPSGQVLPIGTQDAPQTLAVQAAGLLPGADLVPGAAAPEVQARVADALAAVAPGSAGSQHGRTALLTDLLAVSCVHAWTRWLPGFADAGVPFALATFVRRPAGVVIDTTRITVRLPPRPHDVVLELAGCFGTLDAAAVLGGRQVVFATGADDGD